MEGDTDALAVGAGEEAVAAVFRLPLALALGDAAGEAGLAALVCAAGLTAGVAIGFAGAGVFLANSATVSFIASLIGIRTTPFPLSTQAYVVSALVVSSRTAFSFSARALARFSS